MRFIITSPPQPLMWLVPLQMVICTRRVLSSKTSLYLAPGDRRITSIVLRSGSWLHTQNGESWMDVNARSRREIAKTQLAISDVKSNFSWSLTTIGHCAIIFTRILDFWSIMDKKQKIAKNYNNSSSGGRSGSSSKNIYKKSSFLSFGLELLALKGFKC